METNYFKSEEEIKEFFKGRTLKFEFKSGGEIFFETLYPIFIGGVLTKFQLSFYDNENDFFCYSNMNGENGWLDRFQISGVKSISQEDYSHTDLYFSMYNKNYKIN